MKLNEEYSPGSNVIRGYQNKQININGKNYDHSLIVSNQAIIENWSINDITELNKERLQMLLQSQPEVIIIGTGKQLVFPQPQLYASLIGQGIGIEFMDTGAACRTYNVLVSEDRKVAAGLII